MEPQKDKKEYPSIIAVALAALCCLALPLIFGVGIAGLGFFTSRWLVVLGAGVALVVLWISYQKYKK